MLGSPIFGNSHIYCYVDFPLETEALLATQAISVAFSILRDRQRSENNTQSCIMSYHVLCISYYRSCYIGSSLLH